MRQVVGVDGAPDGWVAVVVDAQADAIVRAASYADFATLVGDMKEALVVAVDMPIGLPLADNWPRRADRAARAFLGTKRSSVFVVPPIEALQAPTHGDAVAVCKAAGLPGVSRQAYGLGKKIAEVGVVALAEPARIYEVHPEISFREMKGTPLVGGKRTWSGFHERLALLRFFGLEPPTALPAVARAGVDDVLDAVAAAWTAARIARDQARQLPVDARDGEPRIWY
jgi:predicted RNase H-like nuclease